MRQLFASNCVQMVSTAPHLARLSGLQVANVQCIRLIVQGAQGAEGAKGALKVLGSNNTRMCNGASDLLGPSKQALAQQVPSHRVVLASWSSVFCALLERWVSDRGERPAITVWPLRWALALGQRH